VVDVAIFFFAKPLEKLGAIVDLIRQLKITISSYGGTNKKKAERALKEMEIEK
jgi:hypothetical protein